MSPLFIEADTLPGQPARGFWVLRWTESGIKRVAWTTTRETAEHVVRAFGGGQ